MRAILLSAALATAFAGPPALAQISVGVGADVDVSVRVGDPYVYDGYSSDRWYYDDHPRRHRYYKRYGGYDCHEGFRYTWQNGRRARYEAEWCFDDRGRRYEAEGTRVVVWVD